MRALWLVLLSACYQDAAIAPCTLRCDEAACPGDLVCGSDHLCQAPGMPLCSTTTGSSGAIEIRAPHADDGDQFGASVSLSGDGLWLAVGAPGESSNAVGFDGDELNNTSVSSGAVYVYHWDGSGFVEATYIKGPASDSDDNFGASVSFSGDGNTLVVGAPHEDGGGVLLGGDPNDDSVIDAGAVFIYKRATAGDPWMTPRYLKPNAGASITSGEFGQSVAVSDDGTYVVVGEPGNAAAYRYHILTGTLSGYGDVSSSVNPADRVGDPVAVSGDGQTAFVGAALEDGSATGFNGTVDDSANDAGAVFIETQQNGAQKLYCKASNTEAGDYFGAGVAASRTGDLFGVGAPAEDGDANAVSNSGAVYLFTRTGIASWMQATFLRAPNAGVADSFGASVAISSDAMVVVVGAPGEASSKPADQNDNAAPSAGAVYAFRKSGVEWMPTGYLKAASPTAQEALGTSVAVSANGSVIATGAPTGTGTVYVFR